MKLNFSDRVMKVFSDMGTDYETMNNLMRDLVAGYDIYDEDGRKVSKAEANDVILEFSHNVLGITDIRDTQQVNRAVRDNIRDWFDVIEDTIEWRIETGIKESDWFNDFVDARTLKYGDRQDFYTEEEAYLSVAKAGTSHHDHALQRLPGGSPISVPVELYVVKIGADINKYILGQMDWAKLVDSIAVAFQREITEQVYAEITSASAKMPAQFTKNGVLGAATKDNFDTLLEDVQAANNGSEIVIFGTKSALAKVNALADYNWGATAQKDSVMNTGNIGIYNGVKLVEMPNRFKDKSLTTKAFDSDVLMILPIVDEDAKFVKFVDMGTTEIAKMERGDYISDIQTLEVQRRMGVASVIGRYFGKWTLRA